MWVNLWSQVKQLPGVAFHCVHSRLCRCKGHMTDAQKDTQTDTPHSVLCKAIYGLVKVSADACVKY